ncbi:ACT domain-containing protein [Microvirga brassicacearum]|uniref:ACT domain-containing protein n=1 Tax=Microvirga brassicacearum TaxID=2580413 RepID=A0A5N3P551_9HYPH|nr:ACT domain-containing protein [Microvirga brassicacearum]KAB0264862.1 ACT domain-containing protein [Microvirga brassicacearum]
MAISVKLRVLEGVYGIARLGPTEPFPAWADGEGFVSISRSPDELSIVCLENRIVAGVQKDGGWTGFQLVGPFAFGETGIILSVIRPLSEEGIGVFVVSTFDGDHLLVKQEDASRVMRLLSEAGHVIGTIG